MKAIDIDYSVKKNQDTLINILVCSLICFKDILFLFATYIRKLVINTYKLDTLFLYGLVVLIIICSIKTFTKRIRFDSIVIYLFFVLASLISLLSIASDYFLNDEYMEYLLSLMVRLLVFCIPCYILTRCIRDYKSLLRNLELASIIMSVSLIIRVFFNPDTVFVEDSTYSMELAYLFLPAAIISTNTLFTKIKMIYLINAIVSLSMIFAMGTRGPLLCYILFLGLKGFLFLYERIRKVQLMLISIVTFLFALIILNYYHIVITSLINLFMSMELSTRSLERMLDASFFTDNARTNLIYESMNIISDNPFTGVGIGNERILLAKAMGNLSEFTGLYPHNIFIEIFLQFGMFLGLIFNVVIVVLILNALFKSKNKEYKSVLCIFMAVGLFPLFVSMSYLGSTTFFAFLGLCINSLSINKNPKLL